MRKGKACIQPHEENPEDNLTRGLLASSARGEMLNRPLIRPLTLETTKPNACHQIQPLTLETKPDTVSRPAAAIPPPPAKHFERERYFQENKMADGSSLAGHLTGISLHSRNASSSCSGSIDFSD